MRITPDMPLEPGGTAETHGALIDLADFQDDDGTGVKAVISQDRVRIKVDSCDPFGKTVWLDADDAEGLGRLLIAKAAELRQAPDTTAGEPAVRVFVRTAVALDGLRDRDRTAFREAVRVARDPGHVPDAASLPVLIRRGLLDAAGVMSEDTRAAVLSSSYATEVPA